MSDKKERIFRVELTDKDPRDSRENKSLYLEDIHKLNLALKLKPEDIDGLQQTSFTSCEVRTNTKSMSVWQEKGIDYRIGSIYTLDNGNRGSSIFQLPD